MIGVFDKVPITEHDYVRYHSKRYDYVLRKCLTYKPSSGTTVLDIGRSDLTFRLCRHYSHVCSLGFPLTPSQKATEVQFNLPLRNLPDHIEFDLNNTRTIDCLGDNSRFELVVFGETIEHLVTPPECVLSFLKSLLVSNGIIICQTPNAVALHKRIKMLLGYNPYERLRYEASDPGHIREYTKQELIEIGEDVGLNVIEHEYRDYFGAEGSKTRRAAIAASKVVSSVFPSLSRGQTIIYGIE